MLDPSAINDEQWECVLVQMSGAVSGITANFGEWNLSDGVGQGMAASGDTTPSTTAFLSMA